MSENNIYLILKLLVDKRITLCHARILIEIEINNKILKMGRFL